MITRTGNAGIGDAHSEVAQRAFVPDGEFSELVHGVCADPVFVVTLGNRPGFLQCNVCDIRRLDVDGVPGREIARSLGISRDSVAKYADPEDFSPTPQAPATRPGGSVMTGFEEIIDTWLTEDQQRRRKQRHTAKRVFDRLVNEHEFTSSYSPVQRYVKRFKARHRAPGEGYAELVWPAGTAQVDFGQAEAIIAGIRQLLHVLVITFPFSNMRFAQAYRGETAECVCHGLRRIFETIGAVPRELVFDNATGVGRRTGQKTVESMLFNAFKLHYRTQAGYCNPNSGNEKGNVENAVGFLRRNLMVPEPEAATLAWLNEVLLARCQNLATATHWRKGLPIGELFAGDVAACMALPGIGFDPVRYVSRKTDKTGNVLIEGNTYAPGPAYHSRNLMVGLWHDVVQILAEHADPVVVFDRVFGKQSATVFEPASLLPLLVRKPGAWSHSPLREVVPDPVRDWLDRAGTAERRRLLGALDAAAGPAGFESAIQAAETLIRQDGVADPAAVGMLARRIANGAEPEVVGVDLGVYDNFMATQGDPHERRRGPGHHRGREGGLADQQRAGRMGCQGQPETA